MERDFISVNNGRVDYDPAHNELVLTPDLHTMEVNGGKILISMGELAEMQEFARKNAEDQTDERTKKLKAKVNQAIDALVAALKEERHED